MHKQRGRPCTSRGEDHAQAEGKTMHKQRGRPCTSRGEDHAQAEGKTMHKQRGRPCTSRGEDHAQAEGKAMYKQRESVSIHMFLLGLKGKCLFTLPCLSKFFSMLLDTSTDW